MSGAAVLVGLLGIGWILWLYNVVRYRGLARTTRELIAQNTRLIDTNESLRWQNRSLLAELDRRKARGDVLDLTEQERARDEEHWRGGPER
jgi:hypothetical protein